MKNLKQIATELQILDEEIRALFEKKKALQKDLTTKEKNKLFTLVMEDGKPHYF